MFWILPIAPITAMTISLSGWLSPDCSVDARRSSDFRGGLRSRGGCALSTVAFTLGVGSLSMWPYPGVTGLSGDSFVEAGRTSDVRGDPTRGPGFSFFPKHIGANLDWVLTPYLLQVSYKECGITVECMQMNEGSNE